MNYFNKILEEHIRKTWITYPVSWVTNVEDKNFLRVSIISLRYLI
jgi:hypothetical protein